MMKKNSLPTILLVVVFLVKGAEAKAENTDVLLQEDELHQDITNPEVRSAWIEKFDAVKRQHMQKQDQDSASSGKKVSKTLTAKQRAAMIAKMKVSCKLVSGVKKKTEKFLF
jgi:hypothetical protein